jgi:hypothetical protein
MYSRLRTTLIASAAVAMMASLPSTADAATGTVNLKIVKAGVVFGGTTGTGTLKLRGRTYPLIVSGVSGGFTFGGSEATLTGKIANIRRPTEIEGPYSAATGGATVGTGQQAITLSNEKGVIMQLNGTTTGLMLNADVGGMAIQLRR